jgi:two-component system cell cycle response regulator
MKVLIADNVRLFQQLISSLFENTGLEPVVSGSAKECLAMLEQEQYAFICISMYLQDMNGIELCREIRNSKMHAYTPVILFTSEFSIRLRTQALAAGVTEIFNKTRDIDQLVAYIKRFTIQHQPLQGHILYVEDSRSQRVGTESLLREHGLTVDSFSSAEEAWEAFKSGHYNLVITDIVLAGQMSGLALVNNIRRLNDRRGDTPILAVTGFDDITRRIELFQLGINDYAIKPLIQPELMARIRYLLATSRVIERQMTLIHQILDYSPNPILVINQDGIIEEVNPAFLDTFKKQEETIKQAELASCLEHSFVRDLLKQLDRHGRFEGAALLSEGSAGLPPMRLAVTRLEDNSSVVAHYLCIFSVNG